MNTKLSPASHVRPVRAALEAILAAGWTVAAVNDGDEWEPVTDLDVAIGMIFNVDDAAVGFDRYNEETGRIEGAQIIFALYNAPSEVIHNHTMNLEPALAPLYGPGRMF